MADYDDTGFDAVESPDADLDAVSGISSTDASKTVAAAKVVEENDPLDSPQAKQSNDVADADQFVRIRIGVKECGCSRGSIHCSLEHVC